MNLYKTLVIIKKIFFIAASIFLLSCGNQKKISKNSCTLTKISPFSIVTNDRDTLYLKNGDEIADSLKELWDRGLFKQYEEKEGKKTFVFMLDAEEFDFLSTKCSNEFADKKLTQLGNSYRN